MAESKRTRRTQKPPSYRLHKGSGQARVRLNGDEIYLGVFGSAESKQRYSVLVAEYLSGAIHGKDGEVLKSNAGLTVTEIALAFLKHAQRYYVKNGSPTAEVDCIKSALRPLTALYGDSDAADFGPIALKAVRQKMVDSGKMCRRFINMSVSRIRRMFRWAVENELVEPSVLQKLEAVAPLLAGRTTAIDHPARRPVPQEAIEAVKADVNSRTADMMELMLLCGARPGELVKLTGQMIDRATYKKRGVWIAQLADHKMVHKGKQRTLVFCKKSQAILMRYMKADPSERLFPLTRAAASATIKNACTRLGLPRFTGHWLRHNAASRFRKEHGLDVAQVMLGHAGADVTQVYAEVDLEKCVQVASDAG